MSIVSLKTNLKSLKYGRDRIGAGSSNQPYIQSKIPNGFNGLGANQDFILRGGIDSVKDSLIDVKRITKFFTDTKSPSGLLFIAKQQILSRSAVRTQTSGVINGGVYSPTSTIAQVGVVANGGHLNKQGLNPFELTGAYANNDNLYSTRMKNYSLEATLSPDGILKNRLYALYSSKIKNESIGSFDKINDISPSENQILLYGGGPGSVLGVGQTFIRFADQRTGINNPVFKTNPNFFYGKNTKIFEPGDYLKNINTMNDGGVSGYYFNLTKIKLNNPYNELGQLSSGNYFFNVYEPININNTGPKNTPLIYSNNTSTYNQEDITFTELNTGKLNGAPRQQDFRKILRNNLIIGSPQEKKYTKKGNLSLSLNYETENLDNRTNLGNPGQRSINNYSDYSKGVIGPDGKSVSLDKINALPIYRSEKPDLSLPINDLVKFRIAIMDTTNPTFKTYLHFRALLGSISDTYNAKWNEFNYLGRGEQFYNYDGFTRNVSLSWTVAAQSKNELIPMYKKLNYLASSLTPSYSSKGFMRGNLAQLTIGGYLYEQPGIITGFNYDISEDSPWEIGIGTDKLEDSSVKELPHIIRVNGFNFIPIQKFIPQIQQLSFAGGDTGLTTEYGEQRYIALSNGLGDGQSNYNFENTSA